MRRYENIDGEFYLYEYLYGIFRFEFSQSVMYQTFSDIDILQ